MKNSCVVILLTLALPSLALAKEKRPTPAKEKRPTPVSDAQQVIPKIERELLDALLKSDTSAAEKYVADGAVLIDPNGVVSDKADFIRDVQAGSLKVESSKYSEMKVQVADPGVGVVTYRSADKGMYQGKDISGEYRWVDVFAKRGGQWQLVVSQGTKIAQ